MARDYQGDAVCECGREVPVYKTGGGMLTSSCGWCRKQEHCPQGSSSYRLLAARLKNGLDPEATEPPEKPAVAPAIEVEPVKKPIPLKKTAVKDTEEKTIFDIFGKKATPTT